MTEFQMKEILELIFKGPYAHIATRVYHLFLPTVGLLLSIYLCLPYLRKTFFGRRAAKSEVGYTGEMKDGQPHGHGIYRHENQGTLECDWVNGQACGHGVHRMPGRLYEGNFLDGAYHGQGTLTVDGGDNYTGEFSKGKYSG